jgi:hypothetical protein
VALPFAAATAWSLFVGCSLGLDDIPDPNADGGGSCKPRTCSGASANCGYITDNCGGIVFCGVCAAGEHCGSPDVGVNRCGTQTCTAKQCGSKCGLISNGCDSVLACDTCTLPQTCGGGGDPEHCGCVPPTCAQAGAECGYLTNPCGGAPIQCGECDSGQTCGADGHLNKCGSGTCQPRPGCVADVDCGTVSDGCDGILTCGDCSVGPCGASTPHKCGCPPLDCGYRDCGKVTDACGASKDCGSCALPEKCGGDASQGITGVPGLCTCIPKTCQSLGANCGSGLDDGCGGKLTCGPNTCPNAGETCGAVTPGVCGVECTGDCGSTECGSVKDSCGNDINCGDCSGAGSGYFCDNGACITCRNGGTCPPCC